MHCPMCHFEFDPAADASLCRSCPLYHVTAGCCLELIPCPNCGYHGLPGEHETTRELACTVSMPSPLPPSFDLDEDAVPLTDLDVGEEGRVIGFDGLDADDLRRLVAYGLAPGVRFALRQRVPAYIVKVFETELALESDLAACIRVARDATAEAA